MRRWVVIDKLRHAMTENERKTRGKLNTPSLLPQGLFKLLSRNFGPSADMTNRCPPGLRPLPPAFAAMEQLVSEVSVLLKMLDQESLSSSTEEKKTSVRNLVQQIQPPGEDVWVTEDRTSRFSKVLF